MKPEALAAPARVAAASLEAGAAASVSKGAELVRWCRVGVDGAEFDVAVLEAVRLEEVDESDDVSGQSGSNSSAALPATTAAWWRDGDDGDGDDDAYVYGCDGRGGVDVVLVNERSTSCCCCCCGGCGCCCCA